MIQRLLLTLLAALTATFASQAAASDTAPEFEITSFDFGTVKAGDPDVTVGFNFTNPGDTPLAIVSASAACGCTRARYSPEPLRPGGSGTVTVTFRPKGQRGYVNKTVKVRYKAGGKKAKTLTLRITGNVVPD